jgi:hypothetical protein
MKLCIEPRSDSSLGSECFHISEFIFDSDFYPRENWSLGRIYPWLVFYPWVGIYPWLGMILDSDWILGSDFTLGKIGASVEFILGLDFHSFKFFILGSDFPLGQDLSLARNDPLLGLDPRLGFHPRKNWSLGRIGASVEFILGSDFHSFEFFILGLDFPFLSFLHKILTKHIFPVFWVSTCLNKSD